MTIKNKKILWSIAGATVVALVAMYLWVTPVHNWVNSLIGRNEKNYPQPKPGDDVEYEYGTPVEELEGETIEVPRDTLLDSLMMADTTLIGVVRPVDGPPPTHVVNVLVLVRLYPSCTRLYCLRTTCKKSQKKCKIYAFYIVFCTFLVLYPLVSAVPVSNAMSSN